MSMELAGRVRALTMAVAELEARVAELEAALRVLPPAPRRPRRQALAFLERELASGPRRAAELIEAATGAGIARRTLARAARDLRLVRFRELPAGMPGAVLWWRLPDAEGPRIH